MACSTPLGHVWDFLKEIKSVWWPHAGQRSFLLAKQPYRALACGRRWGKTDACAVQVAYDLYRGGPGTTLLVAPTLDQARILFERVVDLLTDLSERWPERFPMPRLRNSPFPRLDLKGHRVVARSASRPRSLRGLGADHIVVDEAAYVQAGIVGEVLMPMLATARAGKLTLISTPSGFGEFQRIFEKGQQGLSQFWSRTAPTRENPRIRDSYIELMREALPEPTFTREIEGRFAGAENGYFRIEAIRGAALHQPNLSGQGPFFAGLDLARTRDWTALVVLQGSREGARAVFVDRWRGLSWERQLHRVGKILEAFPDVLLRVDATGPGDAVVEWAARMLPGLRLTSTIFTPQAKNSIMSNLAMLLESGTLGIGEHRELHDELLAYVELPSGRLTGTGAHDDLVCALALAASDLPTHERGAIRLAGPIPQ
jgi:hypothetical protein